jgi:hypothetical protein
VDPNGPFPYRSAHGKSYREYEKDGRFFVESPASKTEILTGVPKLTDRFDGISLEYDENMLVFFDVSEEELRLYVYDW